MQPSTVHSGTVPWVGLPCLLSRQVTDRDEAASPYESKAARADSESGDRSGSRRLTRNTSLVNAPRPPFSSPTTPTQSFKVLICAWHLRFASGFPSSLRQNLFVFDLYLARGIVI